MEQVEVAPPGLPIRKSYVTYWFWEDDGEFCYEWQSNNTNGLEVWPRGSFDYPPDSGWISFEYLDPPEDITPEWVAEMLRRHENQEYLPEPPDDLDPEDMTDWVSDAWTDLDYYQAPEM